MEDSRGGAHWHCWQRSSSSRSKSSSPLNSRYTASSHTYLKVAILDTTYNSHSPFLSCCLDSVFCWDYAFDVFLFVCLFSPRLHACFAANLAVTLTMVVCMYVCTTSLSLYTVLRLYSLGLSPCFGPVTGLESGLLCLTSKQALLHDSLCANKSTRGSIYSSHVAHVLMPSCG